MDGNLLLVCLMFQQVVATQQPSDSDTTTHSSSSYEGGTDHSIQEMGCCKPFYVHLTLAIIGVVLLIVGIVLLFELPKVVHDNVEKQMPLQEGTDVYNAWVKPPVPVYMQFWVWDLQNRDDFVKNGAKPILKERGPYTYREYRPKTNITFSSNGTLVSYRQPKTYVFQPDMSVGPENDTFMTINFPLLSLATMARFVLPKFAAEILRPFLVLLGEDLFEEFTVGGYLWGYQDPVIKKINDFTRKYFHKTLIKNETFGLFYGPTANGTDDGEYTVYTGQQNLSRYIDIEEWNGNNSVPYWNTEYSNQINGTDGSGWHPFIERSETLYIFSSDVCRSVYTTYANDVTVKGIPMYRFTPPPSVMADNATNPDNGGFCNPDCLGSGVLNISICREGAPVVISQPHFYQGASRYINAFEGLHPTEEEHATILDIEPLTGAALNAAKKLQLNFYVRHFDLIADTKKMNDTIWPVVWLNESGLITDEVAKQFRSRVTVLVNMSNILPWVLVALGILLILIGVGLIIWSIVKQKGDEDSRRKLLTEDEQQTNYNSTENA